MTPEEDAVQLAASLEQYKQAFPDDATAACYFAIMSKFEAEVCTALVKGTDFTFKVEARGDKGVLLHCRLTGDTFSRPNRPDTA